MHPADIPAALRFHYKALLAVGDRFDPVRFVLDPASGSPVIPVDADALEEVALTLHVPDDSDDQAIHLLGEPHELDRDRHPACDRYRVYFGEPKPRRWIALHLDSIKWSGGLIEANEVPLINPFHASEPRLCRELNADPARLSALCRAVAAGSAPADPRAVGIDPGGIDIRASFGIIRVEFAAPLAVPDDLAAACAAILSGPHP